MSLAGLPGQLASDLGVGQGVAREAEKIHPPDAKGKGKPKPGKPPGGGGGGGGAPPPGQSPYEQLANAEANTYLQQWQGLQGLVSGQNLGAIDSQVSGQAMAMLGPNAQSGVGQWLSQQDKAAQAQSAGVTQAMGGLEQAEQAGQKLISQGMQEMGTAETDVMRAAPYQQLLQSLASAVPYHLSSGYSYPYITGKGAPAFITGAAANAAGNAPGSTTSANPFGTAQSGTAPPLPYPTSAASPTSAISNALNQPGSPSTP
jgi:hypothetical protein